MLIQPSSSFVRSLSWSLLVLFASSSAALGLDGQTETEPAPQNMAAESSAVEVAPAPAPAASFELTWKAEAGSGYSGMASDAAHVYTMYSSWSSDVLGAFSVVNGEEVWSYSIAPTYAGHDGSHDGPVSTPVVAGDRVCGLAPEGALFCLQAASGELIWRVDLVADHAAEVPFYGMSTTPLVVGDKLILQFTVDGKSSISGFSLADGSKAWAAGSDTINYQSPIAIEVGGDAQVLAVGDSAMYGVDPASGELVWEYDHGGDGAAIGSGGLQPVLAGPNRVLLMHKRDASKLVELTKKDDGSVEVVDVWEGAAIKNTYSTPVYDSGYFYGYSNRFLTCVNAQTGETVWRSREPGDGFLTQLADKLAILTKKGSLHLVEMTPEGYEEWNRLELFDTDAWTLPLVAGDRLYARGMKEIARVDLSEMQERPDFALDVPEDLRSSFFLMAMGGVLKASDPTQMIGTFWNSVDITPLREGNGALHFVYRGPGDDIALVSDLTGSRHEEPLYRLPGTDFFFFSTLLDPAARFSYHFVRDYEEVLLDPRNAKTFEDGDETRNWYSMPGHVEPAYLSSAATNVGAVERIDFDYSAVEGVTPVDVYLPHGYEDGDGRYPVVYVHDGADAMEQGGLVAALDGLIAAEWVEPLIAVFVHEPEGRREGTVAERWDLFFAGIANELVGEIDHRFRTRADAASRASLAAGWAASRSLYGSLKHSDTFGAAALHSVYMLDSAQSVIDPLLPEAAEGDSAKSLALYMDWGEYDIRADAEAWNMPEINRALAEQIRAAGYEASGGEVPQGSGWIHWKTRVGDSLSTLFPGSAAPVPSDDEEPEEAEQISLGS